MTGFKEVLDIKRRAGLNAAFMHDVTKVQPTPEEKVWTDFYMLLKDKLEKEAPPEFQAVNKRLSELIPIEQALIRRIPIAERQNVLNVADIVSLSAGAIDPRALTIGVLNRVLKSGTVANKLMQAGSKIEGAGAKLKPTDDLIKSIPSNNAGFARLPFSTPAVGKTAISDAKAFGQYRGSHQIRDAVEIKSVNLDNLKEEVRALDGYISNEKLKDFNNLKKLHSNPNGEVKIYRASPINELNEGDWVTTNKTYANNIKQQNGGKVYEYTVKVSDLNLPKDILSNPSGARFSAFQYNPKANK